MPTISFDQGKTNIVQVIEPLAYATEKVDSFLQVIQPDHYQLCDDDAVYVIEAAGAVGRGIDPVYITLAEVDQPSIALIIQRITTP